MRTIFSNMLFSAASLTLTAGLVAYADPGIASVPQPATAQTRVVYGDLDLQTAAGRATLDQRLHSAADQVCTTGAMTDRFESGACRKQAIANAREALGAKTADAGTTAVQVAAN
jgi:UrcA family protein